VRPSQALGPLRCQGFIKNLSAAFFCRPLQRKVVCFAVAFNLLLWPGPGLVTQHLLAAASQMLGTRVGFQSYEAFFLRSLLSRSALVTQHETMADRALAVARIRLNPVKFVGYLDETITFTALATDYLDRTIQGVKFTWEESDLANKLRIDEAGRATFLQPGLARITCRAGNAVATAAVLIRPNHRPLQTDAQWRADQAALRVDGTTQGINGSDSTNLIASLLDKLTPTVYAQGTGTGTGTGGSTDFAYAELWSDPANLVGSPRNRVIESTRLGTVLPEGSNFNLAVPIINLGGRGIGASLALY
jgi:hypothetical protein